MRVSSDLLHEFSVRLIQNLGCIGRLTDNELVLFSPVTYQEDRDNPAVEDM